MGKTIYQRESLKRMFQGKPTGKPQKNVLVYSIYMATALILIARK